MSLKLRHKPNGSARALILSFHCRVDADVLGAHPIASVEMAPYTREVPRETISSAKRYAGVGEGAHVTLVGFSGGCQPLRSLLMLGVESVSVVTIDGTHSTWPPHPAHIETWQRLAERARAGACQWIATCTQQTYTEMLPRGAFASSVTVLERATGLRLRDPSGPVAGALAWREGGLYVESHPSGNMDADAHVRQVREHLPRLMRDDVVPYLVGLTDPAPASVPDWRYIDDQLGARCLAYVGHEYGLGVREIPGPQHNTRILAYSRHCRRGGRFLGVDEEGQPLWDGGTALSLARDEDPWCAAMASESLRVCLRVGEKPPHGLRVSVREICEDARHAGSLRLPGEYEPQPGDLAILGRAGESPLNGGKGHVRRLAQMFGNDYLGIGGNENNEVAVATHNTVDVFAWVSYA